MTPLAALEKAASVRPGDVADAVDGVVPSWVAAPASVADAAEVMRVAAEQGLSVIARGAGTRLRWGHPPASCDLLIDTGGLDRVIDHAAGDLVVKVEAGVTMDRLAEVLAAQGQRLAIDTPIAGSTVGGTLATGAWGPLRLRYGTARDLLIGVTIVRADGGLAKAGGTVVKNVAGYDLGKLFTGSYGTLGLIVEAAFRLHPLPAARAYVTREVGGFAPAAEVVQELLRSSLVPSAIEIDAAATAPVADAGTSNGGTPDTRSADTIPVTVGVLVEGVAAGVDARAELVAALLGAVGTAGSDSAGSTGSGGGPVRIDPQPPAWWGRYPDGETLLEVTAPPTALASLGETALPALLAAGAGIRGSAGAGHWYVAVPGGTPVEEVAALVTRLRSAVLAHGGSVIARFGPAGLHETMDLWGPAPALALLHRVKAQFDPGHRLAPGRFVGGI